MKKRLSEIRVKGVHGIEIVEEALLQQDTDKWTSAPMGEAVQL